MQNRSRRRIFDTYGTNHVSLQLVGTTDGHPFMQGLFSVTGLHQSNRCSPRAWSVDSRSSAASAACQRLIQSLR